jgi:hypothetical protein
MQFWRLPDLATLKIMKSNDVPVSKNATGSHATHKAHQPRSSTGKHAAHRYERRKVREFLRHGLDEEAESSRLKDWTEKD